MAAARLTADEERQIVSEYAAGASCGELRKRWHIDFYRLKALVEGGGSSLRNYREAATRALTDNQERELVAEYLAGASTPTLAAKWGLSSGTPYRILLRLGVPLRRKTRWLLPAEREAIVAAYLGGESLSAVGRRLGRFATVCGDVLQQAGCQARPQRRWGHVEFYFDVIDTPAKARWLGFIAADGSVGGGPGEDQKLQITLQRRDRPHLEAFRGAIRFEGPIVDGWHRQRSGKVTLNSRLTVCSVNLVRGLGRQGIHANKTHVLRPWEGSANLQRFWWAGMMDGDGHVGFERKGRHGKVLRVGLVGAREVVQAWTDWVAGLGLQRKTKDPKYNSFVCVYNLTSTAQELCRLFYADLQGSRPLCRKRVKAEVILNLGQGR